MLSLKIIKIKQKQKVLKWLSNIHIIGEYQIYLMFFFSCGVHFKALTTELCQEETCISVLFFAHAVSHLLPPPPYFSLI